MPEIELGIREQREAELARDEIAPLHSITSSARAYQYPLIQLNR